MSKLTEAQERMLRDIERNEKCKTLAAGVRGVGADARRMSGVPAERLAA